MKTNIFCKISTNIVLLLLFIALPVLSAEKTSLEKELIKQGLVDITTIDSSIKVDLKYSSTDNFLKKDVYGELEKCYLQKEVAVMLAKAQKLLQKERPGYSLLIYDGVRPRRIQYKMWEIVKGTPQQKYVGNPKFGSIHNYGAAVDLTIVDEKNRPLKMGTPFDFFGKLAQPKLESTFLKKGKLTIQHIRNRKLLRSIMMKAGFRPISIEWWHFNAFSKNTIKKRYTIIE